MQIQRARIASVHDCVSVSGKERRAERKRGGRETRWRRNRNRTEEAERTRREQAEKRIVNTHVPEYQGIGVILEGSRTVSFTDKALKGLIRLSRG